MIPVPSFISIPTFGDAATKVPPSSGPYSTGYLPGQTFPAEHENWFMGGLTDNGNRMQAALINTVSELDTLIEGLGDTPSSGLTNQLFKNLSEYIPKNVDTVAALRLITPGPGQPTSVILGGYESRGDGGGGPIRIGVYGAPAGTYVDNGGSIIVPGDGSSAWLWKDYAEVNVRDFGAVGDGITNDYVALARAVSVAASSGRTVFFPEGIYYTASVLSITSPLTVRTENPPTYDVANDVKRGTWINGVIGINGTFSRISVRGLGVDSRTNAGVNEGVTVGGTSGSPIRDFDFQDMVVIGKVSNNHCFLIEPADRGIIKNITCVGGVQGLAIKATNFFAENIRSIDQSSWGLTLRESPSGQCRDVIVNGVECYPVNNVTCGGVILMNSETGMQAQNIQFDNVKITKGYFFLDNSGGNTTPMKNISISNLTIKDQLSGFALQSFGPTQNISINNPRFINCAAEFYNNGSTTCDSWQIRGVFSDGSVSNSVISGTNFTIENWKRYNSYAYCLQNYVPGLVVHMVEGAISDLSPGTHNLPNANDSVTVAGKTPAQIFDQGTSNITNWDTFHTDGSYQVFDSAGTLPGTAPFAGAIFGVLHTSQKGFYSTQRFISVTGTPSDLVEWHRVSQNNTTWQDWHSDATNATTVGGKTPAQIFTQGGAITSWDTFQTPGMYEVFDVGGTLPGTAPFTGEAFGIIIASKTSHHSNQIFISSKSLEDKSIWRRASVNNSTWGEWHYSGSQQINAGTKSADYTIPYISVGDTADVWVTLTPGINLYLPSGTSYNYSVLPGGLVVTGASGGALIYTSSGTNTLHVRVSHIS